MTTKDLIKKLQELDPEGNMEVFIPEDYNICDDIYNTRVYVSGKDKMKHSCGGIRDGTKFIVI